MENFIKLKEQFRAKGMVVGPHFSIDTRARNTDEATVEIMLDPQKSFYIEKKWVSGGNTQISDSLHIGDSANNLSFETLGSIATSWILSEDKITSKITNPTDKIVSIRVNPKAYQGLYAVNLAEVPGNRIYTRPGSWVMSGPDNKRSFEYFRNLVRPVSLLGAKPMLMEAITGTDIVLLGGSTALNDTEIEEGDQEKIDPNTLFAYTEMEQRVRPYSWKPWARPGWQLWPVFTGAAKNPAITEPVVAEPVFEEQPVTIEEMALGQMPPILAKTEQKPSLQRPSLLIWRQVHHR